MSTLAAGRGLATADLKDQLHDIQDNVVAPIFMRYGRHIFVKFGAGPYARRWLRNMLDCVNVRREAHGTHFTVNIGFTWQGLKALGLSQRSLDSFPQAFQAGMRERAHLVGDVGPDAPEHWEGGLGGPDIHAMAWVRTDSAEGLEAATRIIGAELEATGDIEIRFVQDTMALAHENGIGSEGEHFGFADPNSQPPIEGADAPSHPGDGALEGHCTSRALKPGEFLLGYEDEASAEGVPAPDPKELRLNGTYMVFRKLYQVQADIEHQFEFVQKDWMMGGEFLGLDAAEQDPITRAGGAGSQMLIPGETKPFLFDLPNFVRVKGGEYLFVPGLNALEGLIQQRF